MKREQQKLESIVTNILEISVVVEGDLAISKPLPDIF